MMSAPHPPKWALRFLRWYCRKEFLPEIEGDLFELYHLRASHSVRKANAFFVWNVLRSFRMVNLKTGKLLNSSGMYKNYFKIGIRSLIKDLRFSLINLFGLSTALAVFLVMILLVQHELSFDRFHTKANRIYEVIQVFQNTDGDDPEIWTSLKLAQALREDMPMVENAVSIHAASSTWAEVNGKRFFEEDGIVAGPQFFDIFDFKLVKGDPSEVLQSHRSIILSKSLSEKYFGFDDPVGQEVSLEFYGRFTVSGVMEDVPANSFIQFNFILTQDYDVFFENVASWFPAWFQSWEGDPTATYVLLDNPESKALFESTVVDMLAKHMGPDKEINRHYLLSMTDLHFNSHGIDGRVNNYVKGDIRKVKFLIGVAIIILIMACLNYINISTARYIKRTREVGVRKAMGAFNSQVTGQFLIESFLMVLVSFFAGAGLAYMFLPVFNGITGIDVSPEALISGEALLYFSATILLVTILAGFYPAFHLSKYPAIKVLKNMTVSEQGNGYLRRIMVSTQFGLVILILTALVIVNRQYTFMSNKSLGFDSEHLVIVEINSGEVRTNYELIKNELSQLPDVTQVAGLTRMINGYRSGSPVTGTLTGTEKETSMRFYGMDQHGIETLELKLIKGNNFSGMHSLDSSSVFINETAAKVFGEGIIGNYIELLGEDGDLLKVKVIGILEDFHYQSMHGNIGPVAIGYYKNPIISLDDIVIKLSGRNTLSTLEKIEEIHNRYDVNKMMTWQFMDDMVQEAYEKELIFRDVFVGASILSFCIALLGMIGLTTYSMASKTKEIGIRKILGASFMNIIGLEAKGLLKFLIIAILISIPLSWWWTQNWLVNFEYRISPSPALFLGVISFVLISVLLVIFTVCLKVAKAPPAEAIRDE